MKHISQLYRLDTPSLSLQMRLTEMRLTEGNVQKASGRREDSNRFVDFFLAGENDFWRWIPDVLVGVSHQRIHCSFVDCIAMCERLLRGEQEIDGILEEEREHTCNIKRVIRERECSDVCHDPYTMNASQWRVSTSIRAQLTFHLSLTRGLHLVETDLRVVDVDDIRIPSVVHVVREC